MSRLIDKLLASDNISEKYKTALREAIYISADQVSEYFFAVNDQEYWSLEKDFPNLAPPFSQFWIEAKPPTKLNSNVHGVHSWQEGTGLRPLSWGAYFRLTTDAFTKTFPNVISNGAVAKAKWFIAITLFIETPGLGPAPVWEWIICINADGTPVIDRDPVREGYGTSGINYPLLPDLRRYIFGPERPPARYYNIQSETLTYLHPLLLSIVFMHCKNIELRKETPPPALVKKQARKHGIKLHSYHVLEIAPIKKIIEASRNGQTGIRQALHRCRGHFKTYSEERPLLGRATGTFFWAEHIRGSKDRGEREKGYNVEAPGGPIPPATEVSSSGRSDSSAIPDYQK